ncbi:NAD(P)-dependent oxidoreductase [Bacillus sp. C1-1]|nr:NAD(P)-dependent oxidoreductase [Bacillus sp. C1-1]
MGYEFILLTTLSLEITSFLEGSNLIYVDVSAATPKVKQDISKGVEKVDITFVDVAMLGPLPVYKHKVPIMASGTGTLYFIEKMTPLNMSIDYVGENPGEASAVKLVRSIFMKGIVGLYVEMLEASETFNVSEKVLTSLEETMDTHTFMNTLNRLVAGSAVHAKRRGIELEGSIEMLKEAGLEATMSTAAQSFLMEMSH